MSCARNARPEPDLGRLLPAQTRPDAQLTLTLQGVASASSFRTTTRSR